MKEANRNGAAGRGRREPAAPRDVTDLSREARRLLAALGEAGAYALPDPLTDDALLLRRGGSGVAIAGGRFARASGDALVAADLAERTEAGRLTISAPGRARLRRAGARAGAAEGMPYLAQHLDLTGAPDAEGRPGGTVRDASESPLAWMARRRDRDGRPLIDPSDFEAGERLRRDIALALLLPRMGTAWGTPRVDGGGPRDPAAASDTVIAARQRVRGALDAVGTDLSGLLLDLCGFLKGLERIEAERRWPARSAKVVARIALGRLAEHYGFEREATGPDRSRIRLWREPS